MWSDSERQTRTCWNVRATATGVGVRKGVSAGELRLAFAGDRDIAVWVLDFLLAQGVRPLALLLSDEDRASHAPALRRRFGRAYYGARID